MKMSLFTIWKMSRKDSSGYFDLFFRRYAAFVIDAGIALIPTILVTVLVLFFGAEEYLTYAVMLLPLGLLFKDISGNSIGKKAMRLKIVSTNGKKLNLGRLILRNIFYFFFMFDIILLAFNANDGRIGDYMAKTKVVLASSDTLMNL